MNAIARPWSELPPDRPPRGIVRLSREDMSALGVGAGAVLAVAGDRVAYARAFPAAVQGPVGLDAIVVANAAPRGRLTVELKAAEAPSARRVECQVLEGDAPGRDSLVHFTVTEGDTLPLGRGRNVRVIGCAPPGPATITPETIVAFRNGGGPKEAALSALGGLDAEIARAREMIELPMRRPDLFARLGVDPPKGVLLSGPPGAGKSLLARAVAQQCGATFFALDGPEIVSKPDGEAQAQLRAIFARAAEAAPSIVFIDEIDALAPRRDGRIIAQLLTLMDGLDARDRVVVMAATLTPDRLDPALRRTGRFDREIALCAPGRMGRRAILAAHTRFMPLGADVDLDALASTTHGFVGADLAALAREAGIAAIRRQPNHDLIVTGEDFQAARREVAPSALREVAMDAPDVRFSAVGGLDDVKAALAEAFLLPLSHADVFVEFNVRPPRGVLLAGPPGVGKTLLATALANEAGVNFLRLRGAEWLDGDAGAREAAIRRVFARARRAAPVLLFFDEIDALVPPRGADASGARDRVAAALLSEIDSVEDLRGVYLLGATRRLAAIDPALWRPGRFDAVIVVPPPDLTARRAIAALHASGLGLAPEALDRIAATTEGRVGADVAAVCRRLGLSAVRRAVAGDRTAASEADIDEAVAVVSARPEGI